MKKFLLLSCVALTLVVGCSKNDAPENQKLTLNKETATLVSLNATEQLSVTEPSSYNSNPDLKWVSMDPSIASVSASGLVTANAPGMTTVYAYIKGADAVRGECIVEVTSKLKLTIAATMNLGDTIVGTFEYGETPNVGTNVKLATSDTVGAPIIQTKIILKEVGKDHAGDPIYAQTDKIQVIGLTTGKVKLIVHSAATKQLADTMVITVTNAPVTGFRFADGAATQMSVGDKDTLKVEILPAEAKNSPVKWRSSDESVMTVGAGGDLVAKGKGYATITAATTFNQVITHKIQVLAAIPGEAKEFAFANKKISIMISGDMEDGKYSDITYFAPITFTLTPAGTVEPEISVVDKAKIKNGSNINLVKSTNNKWYAYAPYIGCNTGMAAIVAKNGSTDKEGNLITDTCWISIVGVSDNVALLKPVFNTVDFGENTIVTARIVNYMKNSLTIDKAVLSREDKVLDANGKQEKDDKGAGKTKTVVIETITPATNCSADGGVASANFKAVTTNTSQLSTYSVTYTYTSNSLQYTVEKAVTKDNGAAFSAKK